MHDNYLNCLHYLLADDAGYVDHPNDPGVATAKGTEPRKASS